MQISSSISNLPVPCLLIIGANSYSDFPNCPNVGGTCLNIHVGEDIPESELNTVVTQQLTGGRPVNGHNNQTPKTNGQGPNRRENQPPKSQKSQKPQEQVPLCKFGPGCTKTDCPFAHPTPAAGQDGLVLRGDMCPGGRDCRNRDVLQFILLSELLMYSAIWVIQVQRSKELNQKN